MTLTHEEKTKAIHSLRPDANWVLRDTVLEWKDSNQTDEPTTAELEAEDIKLKAEYAAQAYARKRKAEYPPTADFMEAYTEKEIGDDSTKWDAYVINYNKVRTENPK